MLAFASILLKISSVKELLRRNEMKVPPLKVEGLFNTPEIRVSLDNAQIIEVEA